MAACVDDQLQQLAASLRRPRVSLTPLSALSSESLAALCAQIDAVCRQDAVELAAELGRVLPWSRAPDVVSPP